MTEEELERYLDYILSNKDIVKSLEEKILNSKEAKELKEAFKKANL